MRMMNYSGNQILTIVLSIMSLIGAVYIIVNFDRITAKIAVGIVNVLSLGIPALIVIIVVMLLLGRLSWRLHRGFWGW